MLCLFSKLSTATLNAFALIGLSSSVEYNVMELEQELENVKILKTKLGIVLFSWFICWF
jgi:hypothetical protein